MNIPARRGTTGTERPEPGRFLDLPGLLVCVLLLSSPSMLVAQDVEQIAQERPETGVALSEEQEDVVVSLPDSHQMALALATPGLRKPALIDPGVASACGKSG